MLLVANVAQRARPNRNAVRPVDVTERAGPERNRAVVLGEQGRPLLIVGLVLHAEPWIERVQHGRHKLGLLRCKRPVQRIVRRRRRGELAAEVRARRIRGAGGCTERTRTLEQLLLVVLVPLLLLRVELHHGVLLEDPAVRDVRFLIAQAEVVAGEEGKRGAVVGVLEQIAIEQGGGGGFKR